MCWAEASECDPRVARFDVDESPAESLAYCALVGSWIDPQTWRECDRAAALEVLGFVDARMRANPDNYLRHPRNKVDARLSLLELVPALPDRRSASTRS